MDHTVGKLLKCVVVTPEQAVLDEESDFIALPMFDGELGVLPGRAPLIGRLGIGELRTRRGSETHRYLIDGGFAQIRANVVTVLTPRAQKAADIDAAAAQRVLSESPAAGADSAARTHAQERARAALRIVGHPSGATRTPAGH